MRYESVGRGFESLPSHQKCRKTERSCGFFVCSARAEMLARQRRRVLRALAQQKAKRLADGAIGARLPAFCSYI